MSAWHDEHVIRKNNLIRESGYMASPRLINCLLNEGCYTLADAAAKKPSVFQYWCCVHNCGRKTVQELMNLLYEKGFYGDTPIGA